MPNLTTKQLSEVEVNNTYMNRIRIAGLNKAYYEKALPPSASEDWYRTRSLAESLLANPQVSINREYWSAKTLGQLKNEDVTGITADSTADEIAAAITDQQYTVLGELVYAMELKKVLYT